MLLPTTLFPLISHRLESFLRLLVFIPSIPIMTTSRRPTPNQFVIDTTFHTSSHPLHCLDLAHTWRPISSMFSICCINVYILLLSDVEIYQAPFVILCTYLADRFMRDRVFVIPADRNLWHHTDRMVFSRSKSFSRHRGKSEPAVYHAVNQPTRSPSLFRA